MTLLLKNRKALRSNQRLYIVVIWDCLVEQKSQSTMSSYEGQLKSTLLQRMLQQLWTFVRKNRRQAGAIEKYKKAIEIKSDYADAYNNLGLMLVKEKELAAG